MKFKLKASKSDDIVNEIISQYQDEKQDIKKQHIDIDDWITEKTQEFFSYPSEVLEVFGDIADSEHSIYSQIADAVLSHILYEVKEKIGLE